MVQHSAVISGSTAKRRINCPGSMKLEQQFPSQPSSKYADEGSMLHAVMEMLLLEDVDWPYGIEDKFDELIGQNMGYEGHAITRELVDIKLRPAYMAWLDLDSEYHIVDLFVEQQVNLNHTEIKGAFGYCDLIARDENGGLHIIDWKFGDGYAVQPEENEALGFYAAGVFYSDDDELNDFTQEMFTQGMCNFEYTEVYLHIIQPREDDPSVWRTWQTDTDWVDALVSIMEKAHRAANIKEPKLAQGDWCQYCKAQVGCPEYHQSLAILNPEPVGSFTINQLGDALAKARVLKPWFEKLEEFAHKVATAGTAVPGFKLVNKRRGARRWRDPATVEALLRKSGKVKVGDMYNKVLHTPTQIEKNVPEVYAKIADEHVTYPPIGTTLAPVGDKRPEVESDNTQTLGETLKRLDSKGEKV